MSQTTFALTAGILIIGNEILSGQTHDMNFHHLTIKLTEIGIQVAEGRFIGDVEEEIIHHTRELSGRYTYVFTTGGIGPTHDDITAAALAKAFGRPLIRNKDAEKMILDKYPATLPHTDSRLRMADLPEGASLIENPVSAAPGFQLENVYVLAGVPNIMQGMIEGLLPHLRGGQKRVTRSVFSAVVESHMADALGSIQNRFPALEIGSYPHWRHDQEKGVRVVVKGYDAGDVNRAFDQIIEMIKGQGVTPTILED